MRIRTIIYIFSVILVLASCQTKKEQAPAKEAVVAQPVTPGSFIDSSGIVFDSSKIALFLQEKPLFKEFAKDFQQFYKEHEYNYVWYDKNGLIETASSLVSGLENPSAEGVNLQVPYKDSLELLLHSATDTVNKLKPDINTELMLTGQYFTYAKKVWTGQLAGKTDSLDWFLPRKKFAYSALLDSNLKTGTMAELGGPIVSAQYNGLRKQLAAYREMEKAGADIIVPSTKAILKPGAHAELIPALRKRLLQLGYGQQADTTDLYDSTLANAVKLAKPRYGWKADALVTSGFIKDLNVPVKKRMEQIMVNMERMRWVPADTSSEFILVNVPEFALHYFEANKEVWGCDVVVGKPMTKTVIFSGKLQTIVLSPYWYVPQSIINKEIKPGMARNKNYLANHRMEWNNGQVRQKPGANNSLGLVKFLFPNSNNIYLHDSPAKSLFNEDQRAFSHGCVRVAKPFDLAKRLLRNYPQWTDEKIKAAMNLGKETYVSVKPTIPVYIGYFTAFVSSDGALNFRPDIYQRDERLWDMLSN